MTASTTASWRSRHGVLLAVQNAGVLLTGPSGSGKSSLALELIAAGHTLISDDAPLLRRTPGGVLEGCCPALLRELLHVRGLGVVNVVRLFGSRAMTDHHRVDLWIRLGDTPQQNLDGLEQAELLEVELPVLRLPATPTLNRVVWVECAVRVVRQAAAGYHAGRELAQRQARILNGKTTCA